MDYSKAIIDANGIKDANTIEVGQTLIIPDVAGQVMTSDNDKGATPSPTPTAAMMKKADDVMEKEKTDSKMTPAMTISITGDTYTVKKGDYLWDIAKRAYGDGNKYTLIIEANTLRNPDRLEEGTVLKPVSYTHLLGRLGSLLASALLISSCLLYTSDLLFKLMCNI